LAGYVSKGIALCGKGLVRDARAAFDVASIFIEDSATSHLLLLIKVHLICLVYSLLQYVFEAIALFNADQHNEAMVLIIELAAASPDADLGCRVVEVSVRQLCSVIDA
jgi:predicted secreted protein